MVIFKAIFWFILSLRLYQPMSSYDIDTTFLSMLTKLIYLTIQH